MFFTLQNQDIEESGEVENEDGLNYIAHSNIADFANVTDPRNEEPCPIKPVIFCKEEESLSFDHTVNHNQDFDDVNSMSTFLPLVCSEYTSNLNIKQHNYINWVCKFCLHFRKLAFNEIEKKRDYNMMRLKINFLTVEDKFFENKWCWKEKINVENLTMSLWHFLSLYINGWHN